MPFSASTIPSTVGLYINRLIDPAGKLSNLRITNGGSGYDSNNPPTVQITGGGGSGAIIDPVIQNGQIIAIRFRWVSGQGYQRGSGYVSVPTISFVGGVGAGAAATADLSQNTTILGIPANENSLLQFVYNHGINYLIFYDLSYMNWGSATSINTSSPGTNLLASFIQKARQSGVTAVAACRSGSQTTVNQVITYNNQRGSASERFDCFNVENEWWNGDVSFSTYLSNLQYVYNTCSNATYPLKVEIYIGWPDPGEMIQLLPYMDRLLIHDYSPALIPDYNYTRSRLRNIAADCNSIGKTLEIMPIFSAEKIANPWNAEYEFMGAYYTAHTIYDAYYSWGVPYNSTTRGSYNNETDANVRNRLNPVGHVIFSQSLLRASNPLLPSGGTTCVASIFAQGPTTVPLGGSVILTATPGSEYLWSPNGEIIQEITATTSGNYSCRVISGSCTAYTNVISVSITNNIFEPYIIPDGPVFFTTGGSVILSAATVVTGVTEPYSYKWYSATTSAGTYYNFSNSNPITARITGYYFVGVSGSTSNFSGNSEIIYIDSNYNLNSGGQTEETTELVLNNFIEYTDSDSDFPWLNYSILLLDITQADYFVFVKVKSRTGRKTGVKISVDGGKTYTSITNIKNTDDFYWYRIGVKLYGNSIELLEQRTTVSLQANNNSLMISSFAFSSNPNFIPGPYPA